MAKFTLEDLARVTIEIAMERPDYRYIPPGTMTWCLYSHGKDPGCIFGHALARWIGIDIATLENRGIAWHLARWFGGDRTDPQYAPFAETQSLQDRREPWGTCIAPLLAAYPQFRKAVDA